MMLGLHADFVLWTSDQCRIKYKDPILKCNILLWVLVLSAGFMTKCPHVRPTFMVIVFTIDCGILYFIGLLVFAFDSGNISCASGL